MSLNAPPKDKMIHAPTAKKGFHFASDGRYFAEFIEAETIQDATDAYHKLKRLMPGQSTETPEVLSTPTSIQDEEEKEL